MPSLEGVGARRAALQMLDSVLRHGQTLEGAHSATRGLSPPDAALLDTAQVRASFKSKGQNFIFMTETKS